MMLPFYEVLRYNKWEVLQLLDLTEGECGLRIGTKRLRVFSAAVGVILAGMLSGCAAVGQQAVMEQPHNQIQEAPEEMNTAFQEQMQIEEIAAADVTIREQMEIAQTSEEMDWPDAMEALLNDMYGDYREEGGEVAFLPDGTLMDGVYNENIYNGIRMYALAAGVSFSYYDVEESTHEDYRNAIIHAADNHARVIVCAGENFQKAVGELQDVYPQISFLLIDGVPIEESGAAIEIAENVHCVAFKEEQSGYLAGYMAVLEGYRRFGFIGGVEAASVIRYGYGYLQGIDDAAARLQLDDVIVNYWYAGTYAPELESQEKASGWYDSGTEVIFACGGPLYESVLQAAEEKDGIMIGVDVDQSRESERILTSAIKDSANAVIISLDDFYAAGGRWSESYAGKRRLYGAKENCTGIPVTDTEWRFENVTTDEYYKLFHQVRRGEIEVSDAVEERPQVSITVNY